MWTFACILLCQPAEKTLFAAPSANIPSPLQKKKKAETTTKKKNNSIPHISWHPYGLAQSWHHTYSPFHITLQRKCLTCSTSPADLWRVMKGSTDPGAACHHLCVSQFHEVDDMGKMLQYNQYRFCKKNKYMAEVTQGSGKVFHLLLTLGTVLHLIYKCSRFLHKKQAFKLNSSVYFYEQWIKFAASPTLGNPQEVLWHSLNKLLFLQLCKVPFLICSHHSHLPSIRLMCSTKQQAAQATSQWAEQRIFWSSLRSCWPN